MDYAALPPEVNSGRMYAGAGSGPLMAAASGWDSLATELGSAAQSYESVVSELTGGLWHGASSAAAASAAAPYVAWMSATASQAEQTANQARAAAAAYEVAFAATVPPPLIAANRALLAVLVVTNILGQNTAAIAANEAQYAEYWAQDAGAMYGYASSSAGATMLTSFIEPKENTNLAGVSAQAAAVGQATSTSTASNTTSVLSQAASAVPNALSSIAQGTNPVSYITSWIDQLANLLSTPLASDINYFAYNVGATTSAMSGPWFLACVFPSLLSPLFELAYPATGLAGATSAAPDALGSALVDSTVATPAGAAGLVGAQVSAGIGQAASVSGLSVPTTWTASAPEIRLASTASPLNSPPTLEGAAEAGAGAGSWFGGVPVMGNTLNATRDSGGDSRSGVNSSKTGQDSGRLGVAQNRMGWWSQPERRSAAVDEDALTEREHEELAELRKEINDLAMERDATARLIKEAIAR